MQRPYAPPLRSMIRTAVLALALTSLAAGLAAADGLPDPGFEIEAGRTAPLVTDPQIDFLSPDGVAWGVVGKNVADTKTVVAEIEASALN